MKIITFLARTYLYDMYTFEEHFHPRNIFPLKPPSKLFCVFQNSIFREKWTF